MWPLAPLDLGATNQTKLSAEGTVAAAVYNDQNLGKDQGSTNQIKLPVEGTVVAAGSTGSWRH